MKMRKVLAAFVSATMLLASTCIPAFAYNKPATDKINPQVKFAVESIDSEGYAIISASLTTDMELQKVTTSRGKYTGSAWQQISFTFDFNSDVFDGTDIWLNDGAIIVNNSKTADEPAEGKLIMTTPGSTPNTMTQTWSDPLFKVDAKLKDKSLSVADVEKLVLGTLKTATIEFYEWNGVVAAEADYYGYSYGIDGAAAQFNDADERIQFCPNPASTTPVATSIVINEGAKVNADATGKATLTATVLDQNGEAMDPQPAVVWSDDSEDATVTNGAFAATVKKDAYDVNVTATVEGTEISSSATVVVVPAAAKVATTVVINDGAESVDTNAEGNVTLTAVVKDQFGDDMDTAVVWTSDNDDDVKVIDGVVTAVIKADAYTATITATAGAASDTIVVNVPAEVKVPSVEAIGAKKTDGKDAMYWGVKWSNIDNPAWMVTLTKNGDDQRQFSVNLAGATFDGTGDKAFGFYLKVSNTADKFTFKVEDTKGTVSATANAEGVAVDDLK